MTDIFATLAASPARELLGDTVDQLVQLIACAETEGVDATAALEFLAAPTPATADRAMAWLLRLQVRAALPPLVPAPLVSPPDVSRLVGDAMIHMAGNALTRQGVAAAVELTRQQQHIVGKLIGSPGLSISVTELYGPGRAWPTERYSPDSRRLRDARRRALDRTNDRLLPLGIQISRDEDDRLALIAVR